MNHPDDALRTALAEHYAEGQAGNPIDVGGRKHDGTAELGVVTAEIALGDPATANKRSRHSEVDKVVKDH